MKSINFFTNISFKFKTLALVAVLVSFTVITGVRYHLLVNKICDTSISQATETMLTGYKSELKDIVDLMAVTLASAIEGIEDEKEVHDIFKHLVQNARFFPDKSGYIFIYKKGGTVFVLPPQPEKEGANLIDFKDPTGKPLIKELDAAAQAGGGYVKYMWEKPYQGLRPKLSFARMLPGGKYWLGTGVYIDDIEEKRAAIQTTTNTLTVSYLTTLYFALGAAVIFLALPLAWLLIRSIVKPVSELTDVAEQFSLGRMDLTIPYTERKDEIGHLAKSLHRLGMSIRVAVTRLRK